MLHKSSQGCINHKKDEVLHSKWCTKLWNDVSIFQMMDKSSRWSTKNKMIHKIFKLCIYPLYKIYSTWEWCFLLHNYLCYIRWSWNDTFVWMIQIIIGQKLCIINQHIFIIMCIQHRLMYGRFVQLRCFDDQECSRTPQPGLVYNCGTLGLTRRQKRHREKLTNIWKAIKCARIIINKIPSPSNIHS